MGARIVLIGFVVVGAWFFFGGGEKQKIDNGGVEASQEVAPESDVIETAVVTTDGASGLFAAYSEQAVAAADGDVVVFFAAEWCPSCRVLEGNIRANLGDIPENVTILKADYDNEVELKKKYGVRQQHTLVQIDDSGNEIQKWLGGNTLDSVISKL